MRANKAETRQESWNKWNCIAFFVASFVYIFSSHISSFATLSQTPGRLLAFANHTFWVSQLCLPFCLTADALRARTKPLRNCTRNFSPEKTPHNSQQPIEKSENDGETSGRRAGSIIVCCTRCTATITNSRQTYFILCFAYHIYLWVELLPFAKQTYSRTTISIRSTHFTSTVRSHTHTHPGVLAFAHSHTIPDGDGVHIKINIKRTRATKRKWVFERRKKKEKNKKCAASTGRAYVTRAHTR